MIMTINVMTNEDIIFIKNGCVTNIMIKKL